MNFLFKLRHMFCFNNGLPALRYAIGNDDNYDSVEFVYCAKHKGAENHKVNKNYSQKQRNMEQWKIREDGELKWY